MSDRADGILLIVDDNPAVVRSLHLFLKSRFSRVITATDPGKLPQLLQSERPDVILLDMNFTAGEISGREGMKWLRRILASDPDVSVVFITAYGGIDLAVQAIREGAVDFVLKPWDNQKLYTTLKTALALRRSRQRIRDLSVKQSTLSSDIDREFQFLRGNSHAMQSVQSAISKVARTDANVLITGENGTGKEVVARELHRNSPRAGEIFLSIDLSTISESLFESELFGHKKGSFTDAREDRAGKFAAASGGTLFLDEIGNLSLPLQSKLLNVLQNREVIPVGSNVPVPIDIRLICATNKNLDQMMEDDLFRRDLYFRINTIQIEIPPLRERGEDITALAMQFLEVYSRKYGKPGLRFTSGSLDRIRNHDWPGNVRELKHAVEKAVILSESAILGPDLLGLDRQARLYGDIRGERTMEDYEREIIEKILRKHAGNISQTASELNLSRQTLYRKIQRYGL
jgi:DNA-binding NtrC family response regulator